MTDNTEREELAELIRNIHSPATVGGYEMADDLIAAGYRKPRTITTAEELDALPKDSLFTSQFGQGLVMHPDLIGDAEFAENVLPAVVHFEPSARGWRG